ncbi:hypothetical protein [Streptomyces chattanoogensis]|uniref:hypothetical protein n=1 Tax=Streptomyces chattanoogensis TaxID=66876 RepID=UPI0036C94665
MAKLPTDAVLVKLFHLGMSDAEIAAQYGASPQAVNKRYMNMDPPLRRQPIAARVTELLTSIWDIKVDRTGVSTHHNKYAVKNLKVYMRMQLGDDTVGETSAASAERMIRRLIRENVVIDYDRSSEEGWQFVPREPSDGRRVIRWPADKELPGADLQKAMELPEPETDAEEAGADGDT